MKNDRNLIRLTIKGEISNFTNHVKTGHFYFTLKDEKSSVKAVMFKSYAASVKFKPENGMNVIVTASAEVFERDGIYQLYCTDMQPDGVGALYLAFEQLKSELSAKGLFDPAHKKSIPAYPEVIGIVTSKTGAALQDIINIISRRCPAVKLLLIPALVQGENAPQSVCEAIELANSVNKQGQKIDLLIVGRGGGSIEDLWAFNSPEVAYAVYNSDIPVISAVGHEIDFTICDFAADLRAPTPSAAAELAVFDSAQKQKEIAVYYQRLNNAASIYLKKLIQRLNQDYTKLNAVSPEAGLALKTKTLDNLTQRLHNSMNNIIINSENSFTSLIGKLEALSPLKVLSRGYSITTINGKIADKDIIKPGDIIQTRLQTSIIQSRVEDIRTLSDNCTKGATDER